MKKLLLVLSVSVISAFALVPLVAPGLQSADASSGTLGSDYTDETGTTKERETTPKPSAGIPGYDFEAARKKAEEDAAARIAEDQAKAEEEYKVAKDNAEGTEQDLGNESDPNENEAPSQEDQAAADTYGQSYQNYPTDVAGECGALMADCAQKMEGYLTKNIPGTNNGKLGCAAGVSLIIGCAAQKDAKLAIKGKPGSIELSTVGLFKELDKNSAYEGPMYQGGPTPSQADLKPGDILVTQKDKKAGHTGVYVGNGQIVHNSSSRGYLVRQGYSMWGSVWNRSPAKSGVFRPCGQGG